MKDVNIESLYELYDKKRGLFAKMSFKRLISSEKASECINGLMNIYENKFDPEYDEDQSFFYKILVNLLNKYSIDDIRKMLYDHKDTYEATDDLSKALFGLIGLECPKETTGLKIKMPMYLIANGVTDVNALISIYGESIYNAMVNGEQYYDYSFFSYNPEAEDFYSYEDFINYRNSNPKNTFWLEFFNEILSNIILKYSFEELFNNKETIKKEIEKGLMFYLPEKKSKESNVYSNNREVFDKMLDQFDSRTLMIINNLEQYLSPILGMIQSGHFDEEELEDLRNAYQMFSSVNDFIKTNNYQGLLNYINETIKNDEHGLQFCELLNNNILNYDFLVRKELVEHARSFEKEKTERLIFTSDKEESVECEAVLVNRPEQLKTTLAHFFENKPLDRDIGADFMFSSLIVLANHHLKNGTRPKEEIKNLIAKIYELADNYSHSYRFHGDIFELAKKDLESILTEEEYKLCIDDYNLRLQHRFNKAEVNQITKVDDTLINFLREETMDFTKPLVEGMKNYEDFNRNAPRLFHERKETVLATQILRLNDEKDFRRLLGLTEYSPYAMAVSIDNRGMSEDSILLSSTDNLESNNAPLSTLSSTEKVRRRDASLNQLENTVGQSDMTRRINNEIDLVRSSINPSSLLFFYTEPITEKVLSGLEQARAIAKQSDLKFVVVDYLAICNELRKRDEEKAQKYANTEELQEQKSSSVRM